MAETVTRGSGSMEGWLAKQRAAKANGLIESDLRSGTIVDIGCGSYPFFLLNTPFENKIGLDRDAASHNDDPGLESVRLMDHDFNTTDRLPLDDASVEVVSMLAVFEHLPVPRLKLLLDEIDRVLKPGGQFVMTTPAAWTGPVLWTMKLLNLVSAEEIDEHVDSYSIRKIRRILSETRLKDHSTRFGLFEFWMNIWGQSQKKGAGP
jgi:SAM-dependent methyltransferase